MINWKQIKQLEEDVGPEDLAEVVTLFLSEVDEAINGLDTIGNVPPHEVAETFHFLKGSAFNLGFQAFGDFCSDKESKAHAGQVDMQWFKEIEDLYALSKRHFLAELPNRVAIVV